MPSTQRRQSIRGGAAARRFRLRRRLARVGRASTAADAIAVTSRRSGPRARRRGAARPTISTTPRRSSPADGPPALRLRSALQDWLNAGDEALWGFCCNGERLRLMRDNASLTRPAYIEADLRQIFEAEVSPISPRCGCSSMRAGSARPARRPPIVRWSDGARPAARKGIAARDRLRKGVEAACWRSAGLSVARQSRACASALVDGQLAAAGLFRPAVAPGLSPDLSAVAEERDLLHAPDAAGAARKLYADGYSLGALREPGHSSRGLGSPSRQMAGLQIVFRGPRARREAARPARPRRPVPARADAAISTRRACPIAR